MHKYALGLASVFVWQLQACGAPPEPATPAEPANVGVDEAAPEAAEPVAVAPVEEPTQVAAPTPRERWCTDLASCLKSCDGCDDEHRSQAEKIVTACAKKCPAIKVKKRSATVPADFWGFALRTPLPDAKSRCGELKGIWTAAPEAANAGTCQAVPGPWGIPVDVKISASEGGVDRVELVYSFAEGDSAATLLPILGHLLKNSLGDPTYADKGERPQYSWMSGKGGAPYRSVLVDDETRTAHLWVQAEK
jgi:hypothetical protein